MKAVHFFSFLLLAAPEMLKGDVVGPPADIWSVGVLTFIMWVLPSQLPPSKPSLNGNVTVFVMWNDAYDWAICLLHLHFRFQVFSLCCDFTCHRHLAALVILNEFTTNLTNLPRYYRALMFWGIFCEFQIFSRVSPGWAAGRLSLKLILRRLKPGSRRQSLTSLNSTRMCPKVPLCFLKRSSVATHGKMVTLILFS